MVDIPTPSLTWRASQGAELRFEEGDYAVLESPKSKHSQPWAGLSVRIDMVAIEEADPRLQERNMMAPAPSDYLVRYPDATLGLVDDWQLRPETDQERLDRFAPNRKR